LMRPQIALREWCGISADIRAALNPSPCILRSVDTSSAVHAGISPPPHLLGAELRRDEQPFSKP
jgi:hypothetical protein